MSPKHCSTSVGAKNGVVVLAPAFNGQTEDGSAASPYVDRRCALPQRTDNGDRFLHLCADNEFPFGGTNVLHS